MVFRSSWLLTAPDPRCEQQIGFNTASMASKEARQAASSPSSAAHKCDTGALLEPTAARTDAETLAAWPLAAHCHFLHFAFQQDKWRRNCIVNISSQRHPCCIPPAFCRRDSPAGELQRSPRSGRRDTHGPWGHCPAPAPAGEVSTGQQLCAVSSCGSLRVFCLCCRRTSPGTLQEQTPCILWRQTGHIKPRQNRWLLRAVCGRAAPLCPSPWQWESPRRLLHRRAVSGGSGLQHPELGNGVANTSSSTRTSWSW